MELADLSLLSDVNELCDRLLAEDRPIDVLINNAGALFNEFAVTSEGIEQSVALLLLSPWRMTERLLPLLEHHDSPARVINVSLAVCIRSDLIVITSSCPKLV